MGDPGPRAGAPAGSDATAGFDAAAGLAAGVDLPRAEAAVRELLLALGEDPERDGLRDTPARVARAYGELFAGLREDPATILHRRFDIDHDELILLRDIEVFSLCEHHLLPFFGKCHVAYVPRTQVIGLSKIPRLVDVFSRRLQVQERLTNEIAECIRETIDPLGVGVIMQGTHLCMAMRGVEKQNSATVTSAMLGTFRSDARTRAEFLQLVK